MTTTNKLRQFRVLPIGGAKKRTNDNTGDQAEEDGPVKYDHP
jgi:hypothetical protein